MLGKRRTNPMILKLSELFLSGDRINFNPTGTFKVTSSPRSPLDHKIQSPRFLKNYDHDAVGLGIVIMLNKASGISTSEGGHEILAKHARCCTNMNRSGPISVDFSSKDQEGVDRKGGELLMEEEGLENHTCVSRNDCPNNTVCWTKVYCGGGDQFKANDSRIRLEPKLHQVVGEEFPVFPTSEFLSSCHLCKKKLHGEDIYMYR